LAGVTNIGDTMAVATIQRLVKRRGRDKAKSVMDALVKGGRAPIVAAEIDAVEAIMMMVRPETTVDEMAKVLQVGSDMLMLKAKMQAASDEKPHKHVLFNMYMDLLEKQTGVVRAVAS
jgi:hypothetical protein